MNKNKKIAMAVVATVMAGTMVVPLAACTPDETKATAQEKLSYTLDAEGNLSYAATTTLKFDIGDKKERTPSFSGASLITGTIKLPDGKEYTGDSLKPAWQAMTDKLNFKLEAPFGAESQKIKYYEATTGGLATVDLLSDSTATIVSKSLENTSTFLDLNQYLDVMPNYKAFLEANPMVYMSLTSDTDTGAMYYAPYFDGNDDIEKYVLTKTNWVTALLTANEYDTTTTFKSQAEAKLAANKDLKNVKGTKTSAESFMGTTGSYTIETTTKDGKSTQTVKVDYDAALTDAKDTTTAGAIGKILSDAGLEATAIAAQTSGNIVDIQNTVINAKEGVVTGEVLLKILQRYVDVAYKVGSNAAYTNRDEVFNGVNAAWDVDLLTALSRCLVTNPGIIPSGTIPSSGTSGWATAGSDKHIGETGTTGIGDLYAISARGNTVDRLNDMISFAGELYGARGLESRYEYSYIDNAGNLQDARAQGYTYEALKKLNNLVNEGLVYFGDKVGSGTTSTAVKDKIQSMMIHDYVNTQTPAGYRIQEGIEAGNYNLESSYYFTPIVTPVSKWDVDGDGNHTDVMRFTESWRSVKNSGVAIPYDAVKGNPDKLSAMLKFIDYLFSPDGQIAMTYGPMAEDKTGTNGFWYNEEADAEQIAAGQYFEYEGKKYYSEVYYAGAWQPTLTTNTLNAYLGKEPVYDITYNGGNGNRFSQNCQRSYTNFARYVIGSALVLGNKLQSFEYQATSDMGIAGANVVDTCLTNGTIKHVTLTVDSNNWWYTIVPSAVPLTTAQAAYINNNCYSLNQVAFTGSSSDSDNYFVSIAKNGLKDGSKGAGYAISGTPEGCISTLNGVLNLDTYVAYKQMGWNKLKTYYTDVVAPKLG